jgi:hypothetical protein
MPEPCHRPCGDDLAPRSSKISPVICCMVQREERERERGGATPDEHIVAFLPASRAADEKWGSQHEEGSTVHQEAEAPKHNPVD